MLTLKGPRLGGSHKARMEVETPVEYEAAKRILELLDFRVNETYSKLREEYRLDGCQVCLDHIPESGWFVEIEGKTEAQIKFLKSIAEALDESYLAMQSRVLSELEGKLKTATLTLDQLIEKEARVKEDEE